MAMFRSARVDYVRVGKLVLLWLAMCSPLLFQFGDDIRPMWTLGLCLTVITSALVLSQSRPLTVCLAVLAISAVDWRLFLTVSVLAYQVGRRRPLGGRTVWAFVGSVVSGTAVLVVPGVDLYTWLVWLAGAVVFALLPVLAGSFRRLQVGLVRAGWDRAVQLEREQQIIAEQARLQERARMAHDMHDSLGHELSLIALRAGALELAAAPEKFKAAAAEIRTGVSAASEQLNEVIWLLRDETEAAPLRPFDEQIEALVNRAKESGIAVTLHVHGNRTDVAPMQYRAAYRVVQEALTNVAKHTGGAAVEVHLTHLPDGIEVAVRNDEAVDRAESSFVPLGGRGLTGLRERVVLAGGELKAGPAPNGGFEVIARLPAQLGATMSRGPGRDAVDAVPSSATGFTNARLRARRGLVLVLVVPALLVAALTGTLMALYAGDSLSSRLPPSEFREMALGTSRDDLLDQLPERQIPERRDEAGPKPPSGATCEYYRSSAGFVPAAFDVYRLCFRGDRLIAKDVFPPPSR